MLVCRTGLGEERVKGIADEIINKHPVSAIVSARMASAIPASLHVGDLAFCLHSILHRFSEDIIHQPSVEVNRRLWELGCRAATSAGIPHVVGDCLTLAPLRPVPGSRELAAERATLWSWIQKGTGPHRQRSNTRYRSQARLSR